jgi:phenylalanyl-tRNA synthetase beta chain
MKFTVSWLKQYLDTTASLEEISEKLTALGLEVDGIEDKAADFEPFKVAYVKSAEQHPNADRLRVCQVETADHGIVQVVCGAPNARAGMKAVFAPSGSYIPGLDVTLKKSEIRGVESNGMLVSEKEMLLSDEHNGIIDLPEDTKIGTKLADLFGLNDPVIEISLTPDRADCAGIYGIARDLAAAGLGTLKPISIPSLHGLSVQSMDYPNQSGNDDFVVEGKFESPIKVNLDFADKQNTPCPLFLGRFVKNVKNGPSPDWLQKQLRAIGLRPISALVDITNYMSIGLCRPLHVFDADKLKGNIAVRLSKGGEKLNGLNDKTYTLEPDMSIVCDDSGVIGLGGVLGGTETSCTAETTNVYIECAYFDPIRTALTGRKLQINSDARYRFERGIDPAFTVPAMEIATKMLVDLCGGEPSHVVTAGVVPDIIRAIEFDMGKTKKLIGLDIPEKTQVEILEKLGFTVSSCGSSAGSKQSMDSAIKSQNDSNVYLVKTPSWRGDVEGQADLVEEVIRVYGYDHLETLTLDKTTATNTEAETHKTWLGRKARSILAARGLLECVSWSFMDEKTAAVFGSNDNALSLLNPISEDLKRMRPSILPNLCQAAQRNADRGYANAALFEVGPVFQGVKEDQQPLCASGIRFQKAKDKNWNEQARNVDIYDAKADLFAVLDALGFSPDNVQITRNVPDYYHPGQAGAVQLGKNIIGYFGALHPMTVEALDLEGDIVGFEIFVENLPEKKYKGASKPLLVLNALMPLSRDFAFIVDETTDANAVLVAAKFTDRKLISNASLFDVYQGKGVEEGKKSIAISVTIQPEGNALTDQDIEALSQKIIAEVGKKTGGVLR